MTHQSLCDFTIEAQLFKLETRMPKFIKGIALVLGLIFGTSVYAVDLSEEVVQRIVSRVDTAINNRDVNALAAELSDTVSITMKLSANGQEQTMNASKQQYISMLEQGWAQSTNYEYTRSNMKVGVRDNIGIMSADITESMVVQGQNISATSREVAQIELVDGKPQITGIIAYTSM